MSVASPGTWIGKKRVIRAVYPPAARLWFGGFDSFDKGASCVVYEGTSDVVTLAVYLGITVRAQPSRIGPEVDTFRFSR